MPAARKKDDDALEGILKARTKEKLSSPSFSQGEWTNGEKNKIFLPTA